MIWLIGESNPYGADSFYALYPRPAHASGGRLAKILGLDEDAYLATFTRRNLLTGDRWSTVKARSAAAEICRETADRTRLVLLGAKVTAAFGLDYRRDRCNPRADFLFGEFDRRVLVLPHPSGLNRDWADPTLTARVRSVFSAFREAS